MPPSSEPNASGISSNEGERPASLDIHTATGINSANAPTLLIKPEQSATTAVRVSTCMVGRCPTFPRNLTDHQNRRNGHHGRVTKAGKQFVSGHQPGNGNRQQRQHRHHIEPQPVPDEQSQRGPQHCEDNSLLCGHAYPLILHPTVYRRFNMDYLCLISRMPHEFLVTFFP